MTTIHRLESATNDPYTGGVLVTFDSGITKSAAWQAKARVDVKDMSKKIVEQLIETLLQENADSTIRNTNWVSMVAGVAKHVADWNQALPAVSEASGAPVLS